MTEADRTTRVVADADVLAADLLVGESARAAMDVLRAHSWLTLVASPALLGDAEAIIAELADRSLASEWRDKIDRLTTTVDHPAGDHPGIAAAYHGDAGHLLTFDERLRTAGAGAELRRHMATSVRHPDAFARVADPAALYTAAIGGEYPGPDRDPRA